MDSVENDVLKTMLANPEQSFDEAELEDIINHAFFDENMSMDTELVDLAAHRLASLRGNTDEEQFTNIANSILKKVFNSEE